MIPMDEGDMMELDLPRVLFATTKPEEADDIVKNIGGQFLSEVDDVKYYIWKIDNKYYTAETVICILNKPTCKIELDNAEALIVHCDPQAENAVESLRSWTPVVESLSEVQVLLFVCHLITNGSIRDKVTEWCLHKKFELVELEQSDPRDVLQSTLENNKFGIERIVEALHAHMWPNMTLKGQPSTLNETESNVTKVEEQLENIQLNVSQDISERLETDSVLDGLLGGENADFGELFGQLMAMKQHAASLPSNERRRAAEQLVIAFWKAMGGDPSEIDDLDS